MIPNTAASNKAVIHFNDVTLGYGNFTVLQNINAAIKPGQVVALMGGSGSGKTTLLRAITGQITAQKGVLSVFNQDMSLAKDRSLQGLRQRMGVLFQQGALFTDLNVFENVAFPLREHTTISNDQITDIVLDKLQAVGLHAAAHLQVSEISGGMARRVALARAIVLEPELILYDEPFAGLDPISLGITARLIHDLSKRLNCASVFITHNVAESFAIADQVFMVGQGTMIASGTPKQLMESSDPFVKQFLNGEPDGPIAFKYPSSPEFDKWLNQQKRNS